MNPSSLGTDSAAGAARRVGGSYNELAAATQQLGADTARLGNEVERTYKGLGKDASSAIQVAGNEYVKYLDHKEISFGAAKGAQVIDSLNRAWNETVKTADPNDPTTAAKFREEVLEPQLEKFKEGFTTENSQQWADSFANRYRQHTYEKTSADMSTLAGVALKTNVQTTINTLSSTVRNDPSSLDLALKTADSSIGAMAASSPNLDGVTSARVRSEIGLQAKEAIVKSWFLGVAEKNPEAAVQALESGKYSEFIKGDEAKTIIGYARTNARLARSEARNDRVMAEHTAKQDFNKAANELELSTVPGGPMERPTLPKDYWDNIKKLGQMPGAQLDPGRLKSMVENGEKITDRLSKPEPVGPVSHSTTMSLLNRVRATDETRLSSNDEIYKAYGEGKLNTTDFNFLQKEYAALRTPEGQALNNERTRFFKQYTGAIVGRASGYDPVLGSPKLYVAEMDARRREDDLKKKGLDPHLIYDPTSEYFVGKPANIARWASSMQEDLKTLATAPATATAPAKVTATPTDNEPPAPLRGIAALEWSPKRQQYRDATTGKLYSRDGTEVKP